MNTLIGMTDYCQEISREFLAPKKPFDKNEYFGKILNYSDFLKQPLELWMIVPCDEDGNVLEHPNYIKGERTSQFYNDKMDEYKQAKDRCLFEGFEFTETHMKGIDSNLNLFVFPYANNRFGLTKKQEAFRTWFQLFTIEDLVQCDLQITPTAQKQIGI